MRLIELQIERPIDKNFPRNIMFKLKRRYKRSIDTIKEKIDITKLNRNKPIVSKEA